MLPAVIHEVHHAREGVVCISVTDNGSLPLDHSPVQLLGCAEGLKWTLPCQQLKQQHCKGKDVHLWEGIGSRGRGRRRTREKKGIWGGNANTDSVNVFFTILHIHQLFQWISYSLIKGLVLSTPSYCLRGKISWGPLFPLHSTRVSKT